MCYFGELRKKICWMSQQGTEKSILRVIFRIGFGIIMTAMILQNTISRNNFFQIESFDGWVCYFRELQEKICWISQHGTEKSSFRVISWIGLGIMTAMILLNTISRFNFFGIERFHCWVCYFQKLWRLIYICYSKEQRKAFFRVIFRIGFSNITANTISWFNFFGCRSKEQKRAFFRVIFQIGFGIMTRMFLQKTISGLNFFRIESFIAECAT